MDEIEFAGRIVIGEGERDEAPMLYIGEEVGLRDEATRDDTPRGRHRRRPARGHEPRRPRPGRCDHRSRRVREGRPRPRPRHVSREAVRRARASPGKVDIRESPTDNLRRIAEALGRRVNDITVVILERPRHEALIEEVREAGARIKLITDGDLSAAISCAVSGHRRPRGHGDRRRAGGRPDGGGAALPRRRDPGPLPLPERRRAGARRGDGPRRRGARLHDRGARLGRQHRLRRDRA